VQSTSYWSSTTSAGNPDLAWVVLLVVGDTFANDEGGTPGRVWPVRGGE
jgi:hypothetical protein